MAVQKTREMDFVIAIAVVDCSWLVRGLAAPECKNNDWLGFRFVIIMFWSHHTSFKFRFSFFLLPLLVRRTIITVEKLGQDRTLSTNPKPSANQHHHYYFFSEDLFQILALKKRFLRKSLNNVLNP